MNWRLECEELQGKLLVCPTASAALGEMLEKCLYPYKVAAELSQEALLVFRHGAGDPAAVILIGEASENSLSGSMAPSALCTGRPRRYVLRLSGEPEPGEDLPFEGVFRLREPGGVAACLQVLISDLCFDHASELILSDDGIREEAIAIGVTGSVARRRAKPGSDLDLFVIVGKDEDADSGRWYWRLRELLYPLERDITVFVYTVGGLEKVPSWYVLRMASEGRLIYDAGNLVESLFGRIREAARDAGLDEVQFEGDRIWRRVKPLAPGEVIEVRVR